MVRNKLYIFKKYLVLSFEIISNKQVIKNSTNISSESHNETTGKQSSKSKTKYNNEEYVDTMTKNIRGHFDNMKISNTMIEKMLNEDDEGRPKTRKPIYCTKCKGSVFYEQDDLRKHFKTKWHNFNAKMSAQSKDSLTAEEYDEYILMHPESLDH
jgi:hypothetical protein